MAGSVAAKAAVAAPPEGAPPARPAAYFRLYDSVWPAPRSPLSRRRALVWQLLAGVVTGLGAWYLVWRWTASLNPEHPVLSSLVAAAETMAYLGTLLFFHDIWDEGDTPQAPPPATRSQAHLAGSGPIRVDVFIATCDEAPEVVEASLRDAAAVAVPPNCRLRVCLLDDGDRPEMRALARRHGASYFRRRGNRGFKAGNLANALRQTHGDFVVICDADTRLLPTFLDHTLGYFRDPDVAWVQTPHWFYDLPQGVPWRERLGPRLGRLAAALSGRPRAGQDPLLANPVLFFDVIQRRRNRHGASFCCGAGSVHRREVLLRAALEVLAEDHRAQCREGGLRPGSTLSQRAACHGLSWQPLRHHVSEDLYTSIVVHGMDEGRWRSVYHPQVEARMLAPWSMEAWASQRLKYAGGTFDIMLRGRPLRRAGMRWPVRLHYMATFWSYLGILWMPVLLLAPAFTLLTGIAPVRAYSASFLAHLLPVLVFNELAMAAACKGHDHAAGRAAAIAGLPIQLRAAWLVLRGRRPRFPPTPKAPSRATSLRRIRSHLAVLGLYAVAAVAGIGFHVAGSASHPASLLAVNLFWMGWNGAQVARIVPAALWDPETELAARRRALAGREEHQ